MGSLGGMPKAAKIKVAVKDLNGKEMTANTIFPFSRATGNENMDDAATGICY